MGKMRKIKGLVKSFIKDERGVGTVEIILILVENYLISYSLQILQKEYILYLFIYLLYPSYQSICQYQ